ncbi:MAG TPA: TPM domain-containing protein [Vicinamibacteria bacterium]|jgi:uncharacterized protein
MHLPGRLVVAALLLARGAAAQSPAAPVPSPTGFFNDWAGVVPPAAADRLERKLREFDAQTSSQVVVAVFPELPSASLEDFTVRTAEAWKAGRKELDNGVVLFVFVADRRIRLEVGYGLEGALPDALARRIIDEQITPRFAKGDYAGGLEAGVDAVLAATRGEYKAAPKRKDSPEWLAIAIPVAFILLNLWLFNRARHGRYVTYSPYGRRGGRAVWYGSRSVGGWGGGGSSWGGGGGGGGFSGGGGSFGGGGASGSW